MKKEKNLFEKYFSVEKSYVVALVIFLICLVVYNDYIFGKKIFLFRDIGSDTINIVFPWIMGAADYMGNGNEIGWSFSQGMGQNIFPFFYSDLFHWIVSYFDKASIPFLLVWLQIIKVVLSGTVFYKFLKEFKLSSYSSFLFSILFAFSGFIILGGCWTIFSTEALCAVTILYGFERWLNHRKFLWLVAGITLMTFLQPFFLFMYTILLVPYAIVRYHDVYEKSGKQFYIFVAKTVGLSVIAVFMSSYQLFADLLQYAESPRVGGEASLFDRLKQESMFGLADEMLRFTTVFRTFGSDILGTGNSFKGWQNYLEAPLFYCGLFCLVAFPQFFSSLTKRQKYFYGALTFVFCLPIVFPYFRYAFWAFSGDYFRTFSLVIVFFMVLFAARAISYIEQQGKINKVVLGVTVLFLLFLLYSPAAQFKSSVNGSLRSVATLLLLVYAGLVFGLSQKKSVKDICKVVLFGLCIIEVTYFSGITVNKRDVITRQILKDRVGYNDYTVDAVSYLKQNDKSFYRLNKDYSSGLAIHSSINDAKVQGFYGTSSYNSFNQINYIKFLGDFNVIDVKDENSTRWAKGLGDRPILFSLGSGKYWLSKRTDNAVAGMGFDSIAKFGDVKVYKNKYALPFGFTYDKTIGEDEFKKLSPTQKDFAALRACVVSNADKQIFSSLKAFNVADTAAPVTFDNYLADVNALKKDSLTITKFSENTITGNVNASESKILFFSIPFDEGWKANLNGSDAKLYRLNCGLTGLLVQKGSNAVELSFTPRHKKTGAMVSFAFLALFIGLLALNYFRNKSKTNVQS